MNRVDAWLNEMSWAMGGTLAEQQAARDEFRAHIREAAREHELRGMSADDATAAAIVDLGDPVAVGRSMRASVGSAPLRRPLVQRPGALAFGGHAVRNLPDVRIALALAAAALGGVVVVMLYLWPG